MKMNDGAEMGGSRAATGSGRQTVHVVIPVFNRLHFTRACIVYLQAQTWKPINIIVSDGGSTDGSVATIRTEFPDVTVLTTDKELWWSGSMALGINHVLSLGGRPDDFVLMMNNDTILVPDYVETLVKASLEHDAAVGGLIVDSRDHAQILDAGEYVDWESYTFPVRQHADPGEIYRDDVDVLPGRGSIIPLRMITAAGNVDAEMLPHYLADYEFFCRLKSHGFKLGVTYETRIMAHIEETGIAPTQGRSTFRSIWNELFSRRSMSNVRDHWRFIGRHAPAAYRYRNRMCLIKRVVIDLTLRTGARPLFLPIYWLISLPGRTIAYVRNQRRMFREFWKVIGTDGADVLCRPEIFPGVIRLPLFLVAATGPVQESDVQSVGLDVATLRQRGLLRTLQSEAWFGLTTLDFSNLPDRTQLERLRRLAWNPIPKIGRKLAWRRSMRELHRS
ncbi:glycosyltransferase family 2 protein [Rhizobium binae]|uniref:glycosyltransferase family 2 protein n=1 Tax=Rhizobium binae TaxID=1138190 RepID=UPI001C836B95|nr:glycosyltransferase family 2 protein [Rhizobium binae]MBX4967387.1 glycosyltransferase family 2 protein [Rhizobium binae]